MSTSRRRFLQGLGTAIALPWFESLHFRSSVFGGETPERKLRYGFFYVPNGMHMPDWRPEKKGINFDLKPTLQGLAEYQEYMTILSGCALNGGRAHGDGPGDHARAVASFLTGAHAKKTGGADIKNGESIDQLIANRIGNQTKLASLELGTEPSAPSGHCDSGYSCVYTSNMSWRTETSPVAKECNPGSVFDRMFGAGQEAQDAIAKSKREIRKKSVLDFVTEDAEALKRKLGTGDQRKLDEYLYAVRDVEKRISAVKKEVDFVPTIERPDGIPASYEEHVKIMFDLIALSYQADVTRVITFMYANAGSNRPYPEVEVRDGHHDLSHHGKNEEKQKKIAQINKFHISLFAHLCEKLKGIKEGEHSLLDNVVLMYGSGISDGDRHNHDDLPIMLMGRGAGHVSGNRHLLLEKETPLTNLYVTMAEMSGEKVDSFSDSDGRVKGLS